MLGPAWPDLASLDLLLSYRLENVNKNKQSSSSGELQSYRPCRTRSCKYPRRGVPPLSKHTPRPH